MRGYNCNDLSGKMGFFGKVKIFRCIGISETAKAEVSLKRVVSFDLREKSKITFWFRLDPPV